MGETGSGKTTFAKLLTRLMDPTRGQVLLSGRAAGRASPSRRCAGGSSWCRRTGSSSTPRSPTTCGTAGPGCPTRPSQLAFAELGLADWVAALPQGAASLVGERGESLSVGERQLVAVARAYVADPDLLVLDEATSAVDPATEVRLQRALDSLTRGRTTVAIAHRLSTAEAADEVLVVDRGRRRAARAHAELVAVPGVYADLHASWRAQAR